MPKIPLYNQGLGSTTKLATGRLGPRLNTQALTAPARARANFFDNASKIAFEFGQQEKKRETDRIYAEEFLRLQDEGTTFNLENKDTTMEGYQKNWDAFQRRAEGRVNSMPITKSQRASILQRLAPDFAKQNIAGKQNAYNRGRNIASSTFQSITNNDIESIANLPMMHPDRVAMREKIRVRTDEALRNDLNIGEYTPVFVDNQIEKLSVTKSLNAANTMADIEGVDNLIALSKNLTAEDIKALNTDVETAKTRVRAEIIGALTSTLSLDDIGTRITTVEQIDARSRALLDGSAFADRPDLKAMLGDLDDVGQRQFLEKVTQKTKDMRTELTFRQGQEDRRIKESNENLYQDFSSRIISFDADAPSVAEINSAPFEGKEGESLRQGLLGILERRLSADLLTDTSPTTYIESKKLIHRNDVTSLTQKFTMPHEAGQEGFANQFSLTEGKSIMDRAGAEGGYNFKNYTDLANLILDRDKSNKSAEAANKRDQADRFQAFVSAYETRIKGMAGLAKLDLSSDTRFYDFTIFMEDRYYKAISEGKDPRNLLNPRSEDFILKDEDKFAFSFQEQMKLIGKQLKPSQEQSLSDIAPPQKPAGMSVQDWVNSDTYKNYFQSQDWQIYRSKQPELTE